MGNLDKIPIIYENNLDISYLITYSFIHQNNQCPLQQEITFAQQFQSRQENNEAFMNSTYHYTNTIGLGLVFKCTAKT